MKYIILFLTILFALPASADETTDIIKEQQTMNRLIYTLQVKLVNIQDDFKEHLIEFTEVKRDLNRTKRALLVAENKVSAMERCNHVNKFYHRKTNKCVSPKIKNNQVTAEECKCESGSFKYKFSRTTNRTIDYPASTVCGETWSGGNKNAVCTTDGWEFSNQ